MQICYLSDCLLQLSGGDWLCKQQQFNVPLSQTVYCVRDPHHQQPVPQIDSTILPDNNSNNGTEIQVLSVGFAVFFSTRAILSSYSGKVFLPGIMIRV